jgi:hypothetical protein
MSETTPQTRKLLAGVAAVVLTLGAAGAAVAVNLGTGAAVETPAGRLSATEPVSSPQTSSEITPSTIYVDLTVPVPTESTAMPAPVDPSQSGATAAPEPGAAVPRDDSWDDDADDDWDDHGEDRDDDHDSDDDHDEDHDEGADDDD